MSAPARCLLNKKAAEETRKREWLSEELGEVDNARVPLCHRSSDKYGLDLEEFKMKSGKRPRDWKQCVKIAEWICIDEMRGLLELHYDDIHFQRWKSVDNKAPPRKGPYKVFGRVVKAHKQKLFQQLELPGTVKEIFQSPRAEEDIDKLEELRKAILACVVGKRTCRLIA